MIPNPYRKPDADQRAEMAVLLRAVEARAEASYWAENPPLPANPSLWEGDVAYLEIKLWTNRAKADHWSAWGRDDWREETLWEAERVEAELQSLLEMSPDEKRGYVSNL